MTRHAGFAAVATVTESTINGAIASYVRGLLGPFFFPLPTTIAAGPVTVTFAGLMELLPPTVELHSNAQNHVTVHFTFRSTLRAQVAGQPMQTWAVQWNEDVTAGIIAAPHNGHVVLGIDTQQVVFQPLTMQVRTGPALPAPILDALQSQALATAATDFVHSLPPITASPPLLSSNITYSQPLNLAWFIAKPWFKINLSASRIAVKTLEKAVTVGIDFAGYTNGNADDLVDLTSVKGSGSIYVQHLTVTTDPNSGPYFSRYDEPKGGDIAAAVNMSFISAVVSRQISPQISQTPVSVSPNPSVTLESISAGYSTFNVPMIGNQDGLAASFKVYVDEAGGFSANGRILIQAYLRQADGTTEFVYSHPDQWLINIAKVEIDVPDWVKVATVILGITLGVGIPMISPLIAVTGIALLDGIIPSLVQNAESQVQASLQGSVNSAGLPEPWSAPLPGLNTPDWDGMIRYLSITPSSLDLAIYEWPDTDPNAEPVAVIKPDHWEASNKNPIAVTVKLRSDLEKMQNLMLRWTVQRADTKQVVASGVKSHFGPASNGILVPHHTAELYHVDAFIVTCTVSLSVGGQVGNIWRGSKTIQILDNLDRHHKYVEWGPTRVFFKNKGTGNEWWTHIRRSRIHRTAVSARCKMLRETASLHDMVNPGDEWAWVIPVTYKDTLPFAWKWLNSHRKPLCEYCFFGGPDKKVPFPEEDWF